LQEASVSLGKTKTGKLMRGESYTVFVVKDCCIDGESLAVWRLCRWKEKSDEEAKKKRRIELA
jgi:hypothetical protein